jgi:hypothetical protein
MNKGKVAWAKVRKHLKECHLNCLPLPTALEKVFSWAQCYYYIPFTFYSDTEITEYRNPKIECEPGF